MIPRGVILNYDQLLQIIIIFTSIVSKVVRKLSIFLLSILVHQHTLPPSSGYPLIIYQKVLLLQNIINSRPYNTIFSVSENSRDCI